jgi:hypothetical protein
MRREVLAVLGAMALAAPATAQNPFKLPKSNLMGQVEYELGGDSKGTASRAFDGDRMVSINTSTTKMMGKETKTSTWTLVTPDSMYNADLIKKRGTQAPNLLPHMAKAYDELDKSSQQRFHQNMQDMGTMFSRVFDISSMAASAKPLGEKTYAGQVCEEREIMGFDVCTMKKGPRISLHTAGNLLCFKFEETATSVALGAPPASVFDKPAGVSFEAAPAAQNADSAARGFVGYLASQELSDSLAKAKAELEASRAKAQSEGKQTEMTAADKQQMEAACNVIKNFDMDRVLAAAGKAMVEAMKQAAVDEAKHKATSKLKGLLKKPHIP